MPRFKDYNYDQTKMLPVSFDQQILPGTFEHSLLYLIEHELDLSIFNDRYRNDETGRAAYDPAILLKIILLAYSRGITSSRKIEQLCRENILFMAISADSQPHFTTIADFISSCSEQISQLFVQVLMVCDAEGLIGREMFAIDGCKLPSNASKEWSGTKADLARKKDKMDRAVRVILDRHRANDAGDCADPLPERAQRTVEKLQRSSRKIKAFLEHNEDRKGPSGRVVQSNITDNESAKMKTSRGTIQGYTGVAAVDSKHQVIVHAEAHGQGQEHGLLAPAVDQAHTNLGTDSRDRKTTKITADSGYHTGADLEHLADQEIDGYIADNQFRKRDPRFKTADRHRPENSSDEPSKFAVEDFKYDARKGTCTCPAGNAMWPKGSNNRIGQGIYVKFQAYQSDCQACPLRSRCLRTENQATARQVAFRRQTGAKTRQQQLIEQMKDKIDSDRGRAIYSQRLGAVEPVFGNITHAIGFKRFSLRGKKKVNGQWQLITMIHNIFKVHRMAWQGV